MNSEQVAALRALLAPTGWLDRTSAFAHALRRSARTPHGLLIFGAPDDEPWHMTAHLADESRLAGIPELAPTLVRWAPPAGAPAHLSAGLDRLGAVSRHETLLVVTPQQARADLLERVQDVRRAGATIFSLDPGDPELASLAHESLSVEPETSPLSFDAAQHLVSSAVTTGTRHALQRGRHRPASRRAPRTVTGPPALATADSAGNLRTRLARLLDAVSGTPAD